MSDSVNRLKELLFDTETRALGDVQQRLEAVFARAGTNERMQSSVAQVLDGALRQADVDRHEDLADAVAPLVVRTIKAEIINSRDEMVEALYPITGRLVKAYVASALADLVTQINRRVDSSPVMLRLRSLTSGRSVAELAFSDTNQPQITDLYLIRRGTGELISRWPNDGSGDREQVMSGVLAAINEFASAAFGDGASSLRQIDIDNARVFVRASPIYLLAAKCSGVAPESVQQLIDAAFLSAIEDRHTADAAGGDGSGTAAQRQLGGLYDRLNEEISQLILHEQRSRVSPAFILLCLLGLALAGYAGWTMYSRYATAQTRGAVEAAIAETSGLAGYPIAVDVEERGGRVTLTGLAPDEGVKNGLFTRLHTGLPTVSIDDRVSVLPAADGQIGNAIERAGIEGSLGRAAQRLEQVAADLPRLEANVAGAGTGAIIKRARSLAENGGRGLRDRSSPLWRSAPAQSDLAGKLQASATEMSALVAGLPAQQDSTDDGKAEPRSDVEHARALEIAADRTAEVTAAVLQAGALRRSLPPPPPPIVRAADITAFERLSIFARTHAIFFGDELKFRDETRAVAALDELAKLLLGTDALLRVVGYTDTKGAAARNDALSLQRAQIVTDALLSRGVPAERISTVGRQDANLISGEIGETSPNRRVEFEIGFDGERGG